MEFTNQSTIGRGKNLRRSNKTIDASLNLTPFIDVLALCICFLLSTTVWVQVTSIPVKQSHSSQATEVTPPEKGDDLQFIFLSDHAIEFSWVHGGVRKIQEKLEANSFSELLRKIAARIHSIDAEKKFIHNSSAVVSTHNTVSYHNLIEFLDLLREEKIVNLGVIPSSVTTKDSSL